MNFSYPIIGHKVNDCYMCPLTKEKCTGDCMWSIRRDNDNRDTCAIALIAISLDEMDKS